MSNICLVSFPSNWPNLASCKRMVDKAILKYSICPKISQIQITLAGQKNLFFIGLHAARDFVTYFTLLEQDDFIMRSFLTKLLEPLVGQVGV